jgi:hypothetical protein
VQLWAPGSAHQNVLRKDDTQVINHDKAGHVLWQQQVQCAPTQSIIRPSWQQDLLGATEKIPDDRFTPSTALPTHVAATANTAISCRTRDATQRLQNK